jgi:small GTP-binding protein
MSFQFLKEDKEINITFWDVPGDTNLRSVFTASYRFANAVLYVFDLTNSMTFDAIDEGLNLIRDHVPNDCRFILIGNKVDLEAQRQVSLEDLRFKSDAVKAFDYVEFSALSGIGEGELLDLLYNLTIPIQNDNQPVPVSPPESNSITIDVPSPPAKKTCCK